MFVWSTNYANPNITRAGYRPEQSGAVSWVTDRLFCGRVNISQHHTSPHTAMQDARHHEELLAQGDTGGIRFWIAQAYDLRARFDTCPTLMPAARR